MFAFPNMGMVYNITEYFLHFLFDIIAKRNETVKPLQIFGDYLHFFAGTVWRGNAKITSKDGVCRLMRPRLIKGAYSL